MENKNEITKTNENETKQKKVKKLARIYRRKFSEKKLNSKLLKKIYIPADKEFVKSFVSEALDSKNRTYYYFDKSQITDKKDIKKLNRIAKDVKKQKGRIKFLPILLVIGVIVALIFGTYLFRNFIARKIVVNSSQAIFGAKCDVQTVDFNLWKTRFQIKKYAVANKNEPMSNLFEIENIDIYFNLLELSRGKFVAENIAIEGVTWNTPRKTSGALPIKKAKPKKKSTNPVMKLVNDEMDKVKNEVSFSAGLSAIQEKTDPKLILEREMNALQTPKLKDEIIDGSKNLITKWKAETENTEKKTRIFIKRAKKLAQTDVRKLETANEIADYIVELTAMIKLSKENIKYAEKLSSEVKSDAKKIENLARKSKKAMQNDLNRIKNLAKEIHDIRVGGINKIIDSLMRVFFIDALGKYYPKVMAVVEYAESMQGAEQKEEPPTLKDKSFKLERLKGRNIYFSDHSLPTVVFKNIKLSVHHPEDMFKIAGHVKNVSNNADQLNKVTEVDLSAEHGKMTEKIKGILDLRTKEPELLNLDFDFYGLDLTIDADVQAIPTLEGIMHLNTNFNLNKVKDVKIITEGAMEESKLVPPKFDPPFIYDIYKRTLADIDVVDLRTELEKKHDEDLTLSITTGVAARIQESLQRQISKEIDKIRKRIVAEGNNYLNKLEKEYSNELTEATDIYGTARAILKDSKQTDRILKAKLAEAEIRLKKLAKSKADALTEEINKKVEDQLNNLFN